MKSSVKLLLATVCTAALATPAFADSFVNGSFENGTLSGWTVGGGYWPGGAYPEPQDYLPGGANYDPNYAVVTVTSVGTDPLTDNVLSTVFAGAHSAQVNNYYNDNSVSVISQRVNNYTDPLIAFSYAAVLESSHDTYDSDAFIITLVDFTTSETLFSYNLNSATAPGVFTQATSGWYYSEWISESIDVSLRSGHDFVLSLLANDCPYGGHAGYAYLDGFGSTEGGGGTGGGSGFHYWDGDGPGNGGDGVINGGSGIWNLTNTNWTDATGTTFGTQDPSTIFTGTAGTVTIDNSAGPVTVSDMTFSVDGYIINGDTLTLGGTSAGIDVGEDSEGGTVFTATIDADVTGGALLKWGRGNLVLNGDNSFVDLDIFEGTLTVGSDTAAGTGLVIIEDGATLANNKTVTLANDVITVGSGLVDALAGTLLTLDGNVSGPGSISQVGLGNLVLNGDNSFTNLGINQGTVTVGSDTAAGIGGIAINDNATLANNATVALANDVITTANGFISAASGTVLTLDGAIAGPGSIGKNGAGKLLLNGVNTYTGSTSVNAGNLAVMGSATTTTITVHSGATLSGNGTTGSVIALAGSFVAPGASIGTLNIAGDYSLATGSILLNELTSTGSSDLVAVTGAATLASGAVINVTKLDAPRYVLGTRYTVLSAANGVSGTFALTGNTNVSAFIDLIGVYDPTHAYLQVAQTHSFASAGSTPNQIAAATGADTGSGALFTAIAYMPTVAAAQAAFDGISGEIYPTATGISVEDSRFVREAIGDHLAAPDAGPHAGHAIWGRAFGSWATIDSDNNAAEASRDIGGFFIGGDFVNTGDMTFGVLAGYDHANIKVDNRASQASADDYHLAAYGGIKSGAWAFQLGTAYAWRNLDSDRAVAFTGFADALSASYQSNIWQIFGDASYRFNLSSVGVEPFFNLAYVSVATDSFTEAGGAAALRVQQDTSGVTVMTLGGRVRGNISATADIFASAGWRHAGGDTDTFATMQLVGGGVPFTIAGLPIAQDAAALELGVGFKVGTSGRFDLGYSGQLGGGVSDNGGQVTFSWTF